MTDSDQFDSLCSLWKANLLRFINNEVTQDEWQTETLIPCKSYLLFVLSEIKNHPSILKLVVFYVCEHLPDYEIIQEALNLTTAFHQNSQLSYEESRECFELAVGAVGMDIMTGICCWRKYADFEIAVFEEFLAGISSQSTVPESQRILLKNHKEKIANVFFRQLSFPLVGNEASLQLFQDLLSQYYVESDIDIIQPSLLERNISQANQMREERIQFEVRLYDENYKNLNDEEKILIWNEYISFEVEKERNGCRADRLFERCLLEFSHHVKLWIAYSHYLFSVRKNCSLSAKVCVRGTNIHKSSFTLEQIFLLSLHWQSLKLISSSCDVGDSEITKLRGVFEKALSTGFYEAEEYLDYYFSFVNCIRRTLEEVVLKNPHRKTFIVHLKNEFVKCLQDLQHFLDTFYPQWLLAWERLAFYHTQMMISRVLLVEKWLILSSSTSQSCTEDEAQVNFQKFLDSIMQRDWRNNSQRIYEIWDDNFLRVSRTFSSSQEYVKLMITNGDYELCANFYREQYFQQTVEVQKDLILKGWLQFEENYRNIDNYCVAFAKYRGKYSITKHKCVITENFTNDEPLTLLKKRNRERAEGDPLEMRKIKASKVSFAEKAATSAEDQQPFVKILKHGVQSDEKGDDITKNPTLPVVVTNIVTIKNFSFSLSEEVIFSYVSSLLPYLKIELLYTKVGNSRGAVNVEYADASFVEKLLSMREELIFEGRRLDVAINVSQMSNVDKRVFSTVFVNHFARNVTEQDLRDYFQGCGPIIGVKVARDRTSLTSKGSALIEFEKRESREKALNLNKTALNGIEITVLPSKYTIQLESEELKKESRENPRREICMSVTSLIPRMVKPNRRLD